ncbi:dTDP-4-dehydrorhamnose 3,5-epimerase [Hyphomicrobiales bacterium]|nr:dTDP-4-dehydrorhamnose 3,5-epimerase [Hyphomicrobiales bacterium]
MRWASEAATKAASIADRKEASVARIEGGATRSHGNVEAVPLALDGVLLVRTRRFGDRRGFFTEAYNRAEFVAVGIDSVFVQDNQSFSAPRGTIRGLHFQSPPHAQAKLVRVLRGAILDVVVDIRRHSPTFGRHLAVELDHAEGQQLFVPEGFAHGFCTLTPDTEVFYKVTDIYAPQCDRGIAWNDPALGIDWPVDAADASLSDKDRHQPLLSETEFVF